MSIHRDDLKEIIFICDGCSEELDTSYTDFRNALSELRDRGWKSFKSGNDWGHHCPDCFADLSDFEAVE